MSQHEPEAQEALVASLQVSATQHGLSQNSAGPQSHCSSASTTPSPQLPPECLLVGTSVKQSRAKVSIAEVRDFLLQELHSSFGVEAFLFVERKFQLSIF